MQLLSKRKILIVDDFQDNLDLVEDMLDDDGYENIICVLSAKEAYAELETNNIDLIILDIMMPDIDGIEACKHIKSDERYEDIPIIIATAKSDLETLQEAFAVGANDYIRKPIINDIELLSRVKNALNLKLNIDNYKELSKTLDDRVKQEIEKNRQKEQLLIHQSKMAGMGEMIGNIAHQWRQPLNALGLGIQKIKMLYDADMLTEEKFNQSVKKSNMLIKKMSETIDDFRNFFKVDKEKQNFRLEDAIDDTLELLDASLKVNNIEVIVLHQDDGINVFGYKNELEQVLLNIVNNAKDALMENNIQNSKIEIKTLKLDDDVLVEISDNAGGIPEDIIDKIFDPYFTTKEQGKGTGVGLYMSKTIIETNMSGSLSVSNSENGAKFTIKIKSE